MVGGGGGLVGWRWTSVGGGRTGVGGRVPALSPIWP